MSKWHGGKGSQPRKVDAKKFSDNWDKVFNKPPQVTENPKEKNN